MSRYLTPEQLRTHLSLGKPVEQWLSFEMKEDYTVLKWLSIDKEKDESLSAAYIECFDDGDEDFIDIYEFSALDPDEPFVINTFDDIDDLLNFVIANYSASLEKFVTGGMIQEEYKDYLSGIKG